jgi:hypothetical protein
MMLIGLAFKLSLVPFHLWTPDVYEGAPAPVAAFLATASKVAVFAVMVRLFQISPAASSGVLSDVLTVIAIASILFGNLLALTQSNLKRLRLLVHRALRLPADRTGGKQGSGGGSHWRVPGHLRDHQPRRFRRDHPDVLAVQRP